MWIVTKTYINPTGLGGENFLTPQRDITDTSQQILLILFVDTMMFANTGTLL